MTPSLGCTILDGRNSEKMRCHVRRDARGRVPPAARGDREPLVCSLLGLYWSFVLDLVVDAVSGQGGHCRVQGSRPVEKAPNSPDGGSDIEPDRSLQSVCL